MNYDLYFNFTLMFNTHIPEKVHSLALFPSSEQIQGLVPFHFPI